MIKLSIIIPVYNVENYIEECLKSVQNQTLKEIEIICINDGSTDQSLFKLHELGKQDQRIKIINQENQGVSVARNVGVREAQGKYIAFMDGDDFYYDKDVLETLYEKAVSNNYKVVGGGLLKFNEGKYFLPDERLAFNVCGEISFADYQYCSGFTRFIFDREMLIKKRIQFPLSCSYEDPVFLYRVLSENKVFYAIDKIIYIYRIGVHLTRGYREEEVKSFLIENSRLVKDAYSKHYYKLVKECLMWCINEDVRFGKICHFYRISDEIKELINSYRNDIQNLDDSYAEDLKNLTENNINLCLNQIDNYKREFVDKIRKYDKIVIYGAGEIGQLVYKFLNGQNIKIEGFAVSELVKEMKIGDYEVKSLDDWKDLYDSAFFILGVSKKNVDKVKSNLIKNGVRNYMEIISYMLVI